MVLTAAQATMADLADIEMSLPIFTTPNKDMMLMQTNWAADINPVLANPLSSGIFLKNVTLVNGVTTVNHLLARMQQGWIISDVNGAATIYRSQPFNNLTLTLTSNAAVTVTLYVF